MNGVEGARGSMDMDIVSQPGRLGLLGNDNDNESYQPQDHRNLNPLFRAPLARQGQAVCAARLGQRGARGEGCLGPVRA